MVSNTSSLGEDLDEAKQAISDGAHAVGVALGLVEGDVIPGDPATMREIADHFTKLGSGFERAGQGFKAIDDGGWKGHAADRFRSYLDTCPPRWFRAADAFSSAGKAVSRYADVLAEAKSAAQHAKEQLEKAKQASEAAAARHNAQVEAYNQRVAAANAGGPAPGPQPGPFTDPAAADREAAEQAIRDAKARVRTAGEQAARAVAAACEDAPAEPGVLTKLKENFTDSLESGGRILGSIAGGALESVGGLVQLARTLQPFDPYNLTHPAQAAESAATLAMGLAGAIKNPYAAIKTTVDIDGWKNQPGKTLGTCIPDAIASIAGGAGTASRVASGARRLARGARKLSEKAGELGERAGRRTAREAPHVTPDQSPFARTGSVPEHQLPPWVRSDAPPAGHTLPNAPDVPPGHRFGPQGSDPVGGTHPEAFDHTGPFDHGSPPEHERFGPQGSGHPDAAPRPWERPDSAHHTGEPPSRPQDDGPGSWMDNGSGRHDSPGWDEPDPDHGTHHEDAPDSGTHHEDAPDSGTHHEDPDPGHDHGDPGREHGDPSHHDTDAPGTDHDGPADQHPSHHDGDRPSLRDLFPADGPPGPEHQQHALEAFKDGLNGRYGDLNVEVHSVNPGGDSYGVYADITDHDGNHVGKVIRDFYRHDDGSLSVVHRKMELAPEFRGHGFASEFNKKMEDWYRASGVKDVQLQANIDVGSYAWARQGYAFANPEQAVNHILPRINDEMVRTEREIAGLRHQLHQPGADTEALSHEIEAREKALRDAQNVASRMRVGSPNFPSPWEISEIGRPEGLVPGESTKDQRWFGKNVLLDPTGKGLVKWHGVKRL